MVAIRRLGGTPVGPGVRLGGKPQPNAQQLLQMQQTGRMGPFQQPNVLGGGPQVGTQNTTGFDLEALLAQLRGGGGIPQPGGVPTGGPLPQVGAPLPTVGPQQAAPLTASPVAQPQPRISGPSVVEPVQQAQPFGLSGAEESIRAGTAGAADAFQTGERNAITTLLAGFDEGKNFLNQGVNALRDDFSVNPALAGPATQIDPNTGLPLFREGISGINQFTPAGVDAQQRQAALSGALGPEAQAQAFQSFMNSPGQEFLRQQGLDALVNTASATGGVGGGELLRDITEFGIGTAAQNFQQEFNNLGLLAGQGLDAAQASGQLLAQAGTTEAELASRNAAADNAVSALNAQLGTETNLASAANRLSAARGIADLSLGGVDLTKALAGQGADIQFGTGQKIGETIADAGTTIAEARFRTGENISENIGATTRSLADFIGKQGTTLASITEKFGINSADLITTLAQSLGITEERLGAILANLAVGEGTNISNIVVQGGTNAAQAAIAGANNATELITGLTAAIQQSGLLDKEE